MDFSNKTFVFTSVSLLLAVTLFGCISLTPAGLTLKLTDPTRTDLESVWVVIDKIEVYPRGDDIEGGPIVVFDAELDVDLLDIQWPETTTIVENIKLPPGDYGHFKLYLQKLESGYHGVEDIDPGYHALAVPKEGDGDPFLCVVPSGKFNVQIWDPVEGKNTYFTKEEGVAITVIIDFRWNGNMAKNSDNNLNPTGKAYIDTVVLPELNITKTGPAEIIEGNDAVYTITIGFEDADATNVVVIDTIPTGLTYVSSSDSGSYDSVAHQVTWTLGNVDPTTTSEITLTLTLTGGVVDESYTNKVSVTCDEGMYAEAEAETTVINSP